MPYNVRIYTADFYCSHCERAKSLLRRLGIQYREIIGELPKGTASYPQIYFGMDHVGGCEELFKRFRKGELSD